MGCRAHLRRPAYYTIFPPAVAKLFGPAALQPEYSPLRPLHAEGRLMSPALKPRLRGEADEYCLEFPAQIG